MTQEVYFHKDLAVAQVILTYICETQRICAAPVKAEISIDPTDNLYNVTVTVPDGNFDLLNEVVAIVDSFIRGWNAGRGQEFEL